MQKGYVSNQQNDKYAPPYKYASENTHEWQHARGTDLEIMTKAAEDQHPYDAEVGRCLSR